MNRRPAGVVAAALVLGLGALFLFLFGMGSGLMAIVMPHMPMPSTGATPPPPPGMIVASMVFGMLLYLALAGWSGATVVGLFRMRTWARISAMVIGGVIIFFSLMGILGIALVRATLPQMQLPPNADPAALRLVFGFMIVWSLLMVSIGVWWLVYFALRGTRDAFRRAEANRNNRMPYGAQPTGPYTDFTVAQPSGPSAAATDEQPVMIEPVAGAWPHPASHPEQFVAEPVLPHGRRPASMTVVAVLLLIGSFFSLLQMASSAPLFFMSVQLFGWPAHLVMLMLCAVSGVSGLGILKLQKPAWMLAIGLFSLYTLNGLSIMVPGAKARVSDYMHQVMSRSTMGMAPFPFDQNVLYMMAIFGGLVAVGFGATMLFLLWRARGAFEIAVEHQAAS